MPEQSREAEAKVEAEPQVRPASPAPVGPTQLPGEVDGPKGPEPTRYGDWEAGGRCSDF